MSRPLMIIGFSFMFSLLLFNIYFVSAPLYLLFVFIGLTVLSLICAFRKKLIVISMVIITITAAYILFFIYTNCIYKPAQDYVCENCSVKATVLDYPEESYNGYIYDINLDEISSNKVDIKARCISEKLLNAVPDEQIEFIGDITEISETNNFCKFYKSKGFYLIAVLNCKHKVAITEGKSTINGIFAKFRKKLMDNVDNSVSDDCSALIKAMFLGDKSFISDEILSCFRVTGCSHILVVSGLHMSVWVLTLYEFLKKIGFGDKYAAVVGILQCVLFLLLLGPMFSLVRSSIMIIICLSGTILDRESDSLNSLGMAILIICLCNPFSAVDIGLLLSTFATLGLLTIYETAYNVLYRPFSKINKFFAYPINFICTGVSTAFSAFVTTIPILMFTYGSLPVLSVFTNISVVSIASVLMICGGFLCLFARISFVGSVLGCICEFLSKLILKLIRFFAGLPVTQIDVSERFMMIWLAGSLVITALCLVFFNDKKKRIKLSAALCVFMLVSGSFSFQVLNKNVLNITLLDTDTLPVVCIEDNSSCYIINCSGEYISYNAIDDFINNRSLRYIDTLFTTKVSPNTELNNIICVDNIESGKYLLRNNIKVSYFSENKMYFINVNGVKIVICASSKINNNLTANLLICRDTVLEKIDPSNFGNILVSGKNFSAANAYATDYFGAVVYRCNGDGKYDIRRLSNA